MIDIPKLIEGLAKKDAVDQLRQLTVLNARHMEPEAYSKYVADLRKQAGVKEEKKFNREKMDALHAFTRRYS